MNGCLTQKKSLIGVTYGRIQVLSGFKSLANLHAKYMKSKTYVNSRGEIATNFVKHITTIYSS